MQTRTKARAHDGKREHPNKKAAVDALWSLVRTRGSDPKRLTVYRCKRSAEPHWHVGHC
jgi:hypothetical protein